MNCLAVIPARSGSKGLPDKNIKLLNGKPLMAYSIEAAVESGCFSSVMVSTDSENYASIAKSCGAEVPFLRSEETSSDTAGSWDVVREVLANYEKLGITFDSVMLLQPTSPLRTAEDIKAMFALMEQKNAESVIAVCEADHSPLWYSPLSPSGSMESFEKPDAEKPRQFLDTYYRVNGAGYLLKIKDGEIPSKLYTDRCFAYVMSRKNSVDIDEEFDFKLAQLLLKEKIDER